MEAATTHVRLMLAALKAHIRDETHATLAREFAALESRSVQVVDFIRNQTTLSDAATEPEMPRPLE